MNDKNGQLSQLQAAYFAALPEKINELQTLLLLARQQLDDGQAYENLQAAVHRLHGTAGSYGFSWLSQGAAEIEQTLLAARSAGNVPWEDVQCRITALQDSLSSEKSSPTGREHSAVLGQGRLLVVDDDPDFLHLCAAILVRQGFQVTTTTRSSDVPDLIAASGAELLLIDVEMPEMDGFAVCQLLRGTAGLQELPIIFLTVHNNPQNRIAAFRARADDFINKPIVAEELLARVTVRLERARLLRERQLLSERLQHHQQTLLSILDQLQVGTLIIDASGAVQFMSQSCAELIGMEAGKAVGCTWRQVLPCDPSVYPQIEQQLLLGEGTCRLQMEWRRDGRLYCVQCETRKVPDRPELRLLYLYDQSELHRLREEIERSRYGSMIGNSAPMRQMYGLIGQVARGDWTVLIEGETGVGKELVAHAVHAASQRKNGPFIAVNSAGLSETLLASQLFGHRRGAFTGAVADQEGFFEAASGGTLFLDEIGDLPLSMQAALLRVLQEKEVTRVGDARTRKVDVRVIAASHKDLVSEAQAGRFREDLLYRLRVARITVPPLRERLKDVPMLAQAFLTESCRSASLPPKSISAAAMQLLQAYDWPGNVRELKATLDYALIRSHGEQLEAEDLPPELQHAQQSSQPVFDGDERSRILAALQYAAGNRSQAAKLLGIGRATFYRRIKELGLDI